MLEVQNLTLRFKGQTRSVVSDLSLNVSAGEILCIVGESGCGKSVTALALMGLLPAEATHISRGDMRFEGRSIDLSRDKLPSDLRGNRMAMIFQEPMTSLNPVFRIGDQISEAVLCHGQTSRAGAEARALEMLKRVGISAPEQRLREYPHQLSGGMRQRVMIAMALANDPALLIADEPTTALDVTIQAQILNLIRDLQQDADMGTIMITHDLGVVAEVADTVAVMYGGRIVERGSVAQIFDEPQHPYTIGLMSSVPRLSGPRDRLATVAGTVPSIDAMPSGCRFRSRCPLATGICEARPETRLISSGHEVACHYAPIEANVAVVA